MAAVVKNLLFIARLHPFKKGPFSLDVSKVCDYIDTHCHAILENRDGCGHFQVVGILIVCPEFLDSQEVKIDIGEPCDQYPAVLVGLEIDLVVVLLGKTGNRITGFNIIFLNELHELQHVRDTLSVILEHDDPDFLGRIRPGTDEGDPTLDSTRGLGRTQAMSVVTG